MKVKLSFVLYTKGKKKGDQCTVSLQIYYARKYVSQDTGIEVMQSQFDFESAKKGHWQIIKSHPRKDNFNSQLKNWIDNAYEVVRKARLSNEPFTAQTIKSRILNEGKPAVAVFRNVLEQDRSIEPNTKASILTMIKRLSEFAPNVFINHIDYQFAKDFELWLLNKKGRHGATLHINSVNKYLRDLSRMLTACIKYEIIPINKMTGYDHIKNPRSATNQSDHLTFEMLRKLIDYDFSELHLSYPKLESVNLTRDMFLFGCYTGLRISDLMLVSKSHIKKGRLKMTSKKFKKDLNLNLEKLFWGAALSIVKKHSKDKLPSVPFFASRKRITHQGNISLIRRALFPQNKISFHSARHTFDTLLRELTADPFSIQKMMGHSDVKTTINTYDHHSNSLEDRELSKIFSIKNKLAK